MMRRKAEEIISRADGAESARATKKTAVPRLRFKGCEGAWKKNRLCEIASFSKGSGYSKKDLSDSGTPIILYGRMYTDYELLITNVDTFVKNVSTPVTSEKGDIIIPGSGECPEDISRASVVGCDGVILGGDINVVKVDQKKYRSEFLAQCISCGEAKRLLSMNAQGATISHLHPKDIERVEIRIPTKDEQDRVAHVFTNLDQSIDSAKSRVFSLRQLKRSMLVKMFPRPGQCVPEIRFKGFEGEWEEKRVRDVAERVTRKNENLESDLPLTISAEHGLIDQSEVFNNRIAAKDLSNYYLVVNGEFAYNRSTSDGAPFGAIKRLDRYPKGVLSTLYMVFALKTESVDSDYLVQYYSTDLWHRDIALRAAEGARNHGLLNISVDDFFDTRVVAPPSLPEQRKIAAFFRNLDRLIGAAEKKVAKLRQVKASLLERMFV